MSVNWGNYAEAYKTIHEKLDEVFEQLSIVRDATKYLPVRLTDGTQFYVAGGGGGGGLVQCQIRNEADDAWINEPFARRIQGSQGQDLLQRATTYDLIVQLRNAGIEIDPRERNWTITENLNRAWNLGSSDIPDLMDRATRLLGIIYGDVGQLLQRPTTGDLLTQLRHAGSEIDPRQIRALTSSDVVDISDRAARDLGKVDVKSLENAVTASDSVTAAGNTSGLIVALNNDWRTLVQFRATLGGAGDIYLDASPDGTNYFNLWKKTLSVTGSYCDWDFCAFPYFRVRVPTTGIDVAIDIRAVKA